MTDISNVTIKIATIDDAAAVADVMNAVIAEGKYTVFDTPFSEDAERRFLASLGERSAVHVAVVDGRIAGVQSIDLLVGFARSMQHVATLGTWLREDVRGRGIGRRLTAKSLRFARQHGYTKVLIQVLANNERALRFYRGLGFADIGVARQHVKLDGQLYDETYLELML